VKGFAHLLGLFACSYSSHAGDAHRWMGSAALLVSLQIAMALIISCGSVPVRSGGNLAQSSAERSELR
jgi:hypothetical protein